MKKVLQPNIKCVFFSNFSAISSVFSFCIFLHTHRLQNRNTCKIQNGHQGSGKGFYPMLLNAPNNFCKIGFVIRALLLYQYLCRGAYAYVYSTSKSERMLMKKLLIISAVFNGHTYNMFSLWRTSFWSLFILLASTFTLQKVKKGFLIVSAIIFGFYKEFIKQGSSWFVLRLPSWPRNQ